MVRFVLSGFVMACAVLLPGCAEQPEPFVSEYERIEHGELTVNSLKDWTVESKDWAPQRIVLRAHGYQSARSAVSSMDELDAITSERGFRKALKIAMKKEGVRDVKLLKREEVTGDPAKAFRDVLDAPDGRFFVWIAKGKSREGDMKATGISVITAESPDPGTSMEYFLATEDEYERLGGVYVPMARFLDVSFSSDTPDVLAFGQQPDKDAIEIFAGHLSDYMITIAIRQAQNGMLEQQTLNILLGLDQVVPYGLQDPMFEW